MINGITDYYDFFFFLGGILVFGGVVYLLLQRNFKKIFISEKEIAKLRSSNQTSTIGISFPKISVKTALLIIIAAGFFFNQFLILRMDSSGTLKPFSISINITRKNAK